MVARLKAAGVIIVGKTTKPEFGQQCLTEAPLFGRTRNAWHEDRTSGGSSGGSAVAVASGLVPLAVAPDGGGSTRIPAACNGVVGFKPGLGVVPREYAEDGFGNISYITPMARTIVDTAPMLSVMAGADPRDPLSTGRPEWDFIRAARPEGDLRGGRFFRLDGPGSGGGRAGGARGDGDRTDNAVRQPGICLVRQQRVRSPGAVRPPSGTASRDHVSDLRPPDGSCRVPQYRTP